MAPNTTSTGTPGPYTLARDARCLCLVTFFTVGGGGGTFARWFAWLAIRVERRSMNRTAEVTSENIMRGIPHSACRVRDIVTGTVFVDVGGRRP